MEPIKKGMILAAGFGRRLLPITERLPKPLIQILNIPNILYNILMLREAGITEIIMNLHHLQQLVEDRLGDGGEWGVQLHYSKETELLGTGGGVKKAAWFFKEKPFVVCNCDFITNLKLEPVAQQHLKRKALATMVLYENEALQPRYSRVGSDAQERLCSLPKHEIGRPERSGIFTGIHIFDPKILDFLEEKPSGINEVLYPHLMDKYPKKVFCHYLEDNYWHDTGDFINIWNSSMALLDTLRRKDPHVKDLMENCLQYREHQPDIWAPKTQTLPTHIKIAGPALIGKEVEFREGCTIGPHVVVGDYVKVGKDAKVRESIVLPASDLPDESEGEKSVIFGRDIIPAIETH